MGLGRRRISVLLLLIGTLLFVATLLASTSSFAQTGSDCAGAREVNTTTGNGNKQSPVFNITGTSFRVTVDSTATSQDPQNAAISVWIYPEGETAGSVGNFSVEEGRDDSSIINAGPGRFYLDLNTANVEYTVTVEDCTGTASGNAQDGETTTPQNNDTSTAQKNGNQDRKSKVIPKSIPKKRLPPTGGPSVYTLTTAAILTGVGLLGVGLVVRQRSRR